MTFCTSKCASSATWCGAGRRPRALPADQLLLTIGHDLFEQPVDIAVTHKLAALIRSVGETHPDWRLPELNAELVTIAKNERKFLGFADGDTGFDPDAHRGKVVIITNHKAKGLEWDRVYLMSVNAYDFPSALPGDRFIGESWYIRDGLNLAAEALAQLEAVQGSGVRGQGSGVRSQGTGAGGRGQGAGDRGQGSGGRGQGAGGRGRMMGWRKLSRLPVTDARSSIET